MSNTTKSAFIIDTKANLLISTPELDHPTPVKMKTTTTTLAFIILKQSTLMSDNVIHLQSSTPIQKAQISHSIVSNVTSNHQNKVPVFVLPCVSHMRTGAVVK
ncbi:hypothetical protein N7537_009514 [Penicillium hordei]|uniref:Uncharacterized protein n=1 Tax=Penicillium hordei TaxID=40994 RepID=A0AAD6DSZ6_9EURO|nr:uncharacterized protein N7537_009514 [Penicillium hordei]KAJ5592610.1 hypothetical protein N7537_009514 [Penicillium hordei]